MFSVLFSFLLVSLVTYAATTISADINTGGTLTVSGNATLGDNATDLIKSTGSFYASSTLQSTGAARFYSTARIDGATILNSVSYAWPSSDGSSSQYLQTNGAGTLSWATVSSGASSDWLKQTNYGVLNLTASTTIPYWAKDAIYASSTLQVQGLTTLVNATTSLLTVSNGAWFTNGNIGIGTTSPNWLLQAAGTRPFFTLSDTGAAANNKHWFLSSQGGNFYVGTSSDAYATSTISAFTINSNGFLGIGTTSPSSKLSVAGSSYLGTGASDILTVHTGVINYQISATTTIPSFINAWSVGTTTNVGNAPILSIDGANGRVGIGTAASVISGSAAVLQITGNSLTTHELFVTSYDSTDGSISLGTGLDEDWQIRSENDNDSLIISNQDSPIASVFTILQTGQIGISTTTPQWNMQIASSTKTFLTLSDMSAAANQKHWFMSSQGGNFYVGTSSDAYATSTSNLLNLISSNYSVGIGTTTPTEQLSVSGRLFVGGTGTSTIQNNLYVMGTLRSTVSYVGDLIFSNNFRFIESQPNEKIQSLFLNNQYGENIFKINEKGQVVVKEIETENIKSKQGNFEEKLKTKELQIGSPQNRAGITIYDKKTGKPYCLEISDGKVLNKEGECK